MKRNIYGLTADGREFLLRLRLERDVANAQRFVRPWEKAVIELIFFFNQSFDLPVSANPPSGNRRESSAYQQSGSH
jgi:hypothetical protein